jgi:hypothetical protein
MHNSEMYCVHHVFNDHILIRNRAENNEIRDMLIIERWGNGDITMPTILD